VADGQGQGGRSLPQAAPTRVALSETACQG
jgi:hypothetical protein